MQVLREPHLVLDVETGGKRFTVHPVLTVGVAVLNPDGSIEHPKQWAILPDPDAPIEQEALQVNNINLEEHMRIAQQKRDVNMEFNRYVKEHFKGRKAKMMGHNLYGFDLKFLQKFQPNFWDITTDYMAIDTMLFAGYLQETGIIEPPRLKLEILCHYLGIDPGESHNALADTVACAKLYLKLREILHNNRE